MELEISPRETKQKVNINGIATKQKWPNQKLPKTRPCYLKMVICCPPQGRGTLRQQSLSSHNLVPKLSQRSSKVNSKMFQSCLKDVPKLPQRCSIVVSKMFQSFLKNVPELSEISFKVVPKQSQRPSNWFQLYLIVQQVFQSFAHFVKNDSQVQSTYFLSDVQVVRSGDHWATLQNFPEN